MKGLAFVGIFSAALGVFSFFEVTWNRRETYENIREINDEIEYTTKMKEKFKDHPLTSKHYDELSKAYEKAMIVEEEYIQRPWHEQILRKPFFSYTDVERNVWEKELSEREQYN